MLKHLQQLETRSDNSGRKAIVAVRSLLLKANYALLLVLVIIPTTSGVALIA